MQLHSGPLFQRKRYILLYLFKQVAVAPEILGSIPTISKNFHQEIN